MDRTVADKHSSCIGLVKDTKMKELSLHLKSKHEKSPCAVKRAFKVCVMNRSWSRRHMGNEVQTYEVWEDGT